MLLACQAKLKALKVFALFPFYGDTVTCHLSLDLSGRYSTSEAFWCLSCSREITSGTDLNCQYDRRFL
jgi:hypothetical protein